MNNDQLKVAIEALETCAIGSGVANGFTKTYWFDEQKVKAAIAALTAAQSAGKDEREAFEQWAKQEDFSLVLSGNGTKYDFTMTEYAWQAFKAGRASLAKVEQEQKPRGWFVIEYADNGEECLTHTHKGDRGAFPLYAAPQIRQESKTYTRAEVQQWRDDVAHAAADMVKRADTNGEWTWLVDSIRALAANPQAQQEARCTSCDGMGDIIDLTGEWRGHCHCGAQQEAWKDEQDAARFRWKCSGIHTSSNALVELELRRLNDDLPTLEEYRSAYDAAMQASPAQADTQQSNPGWQRITKPGQVNVGDKLRFTIGDDKYNETAKVILYPGTDKEEIIYNKRKNYYLITSMAIENKGSQKNVECLAQQRKGSEE